MPSLVLLYMVDTGVFGIAAAQLCPFKEHRGSFPPHEPRAEGFAVPESRSKLLQP